MVVLPFHCLGLDCLTVRRGGVVFESSMTRTVLPMAATASKSRAGYSLSNGGVLRVMESTLWRVANDQTSPVHPKLAALTSLAH